MGAMNGWVQDFWRRRRTDPQPPRHVNFKIPDAGSTLWNTSGTSRWAKCCFESHPSPSKDHVSEPVGGENEMTGSAVDRLQETIRFVFSHEQEGLLAIGTFALDQLAAGVRVDYDVDNPPEAVSTTDQNICQHHNNNSNNNNNNSTNNSEFQGETGFQQSLKELPVFGDHGALSDLLPVVETTKTLPIVPVLIHNATSTIDLSTGASNLADTKCNPVLYQSDEEVFSPGVCGLFGSRSRCKQKLGEKENRKQLPPEKRDGNDLEKEVILQTSSVKPGRSKGFKISSLGRLWRLGRGRSPLMNQVSPLLELLPTATTLESLQVPGVPGVANVELGGGTKAAAVKYSREVPCQPVPTCAQKAGEGGERARRASFGSSAWACAQSGKWIRTDSEFVVLEM